MWNVSFVGAFVWETLGFRSLYEMVQNACVRPMSLMNMNMGVGDGAEREWLGRAMIGCSKRSLTGNFDCLMTDCVCGAGTPIM